MTWLAGYGAELEAGGKTVKLRRRIVGLWIYKQDGSHDRLISTAPWPPYTPIPKSADLSEELMNYVQWIPGTNEVSFVYRGALYRVNVGAP
jgi:hypothetical protein